jgi:hypothetical protein
MSNLHETIFTLRFKRGLRAALQVLTNYGYQGEPAYTTDTKHLFINDGTEWKPLPSLDMAVSFDDTLILHNDEMVWVY